MWVGSILPVVLEAEDEAELFFAYIHRDQLQKVADLKIQECFLQGVVQQRSGLFIYTVL